MDTDSRSLFDSGAGNANSQGGSLYDVILADVPWYFKNYSADDPHVIAQNGRGQQRHYVTMTESEICSLIIPSQKNAVLFFWTSWTILPQALRVIDAWGFKYKTLGFEWWKLNKRWEKAYKPMMQTMESYKWLESLFFMGQGYYARANSEPCLIAVKGNMPVAVHNEKNFIIAPVREHSRKPDEQYGKIERLYPGRSYLELFARQRRPGWDAFGNQVTDSIHIGVREQETQ